MKAHRRPGHPNRLTFEGILSRVGQPSDRAPAGSHGHRVILTARAAQEALPSLLGMAVAFKAGYDGHDPRQKCGVITRAVLVPDPVAGDYIHVRGFLYDRDFPEVAKQIREHDMGMSYEMCDAHIFDMRAEVWRIDRVTFIGAAILLRLKAAYTSTSVTLSADLDANLAGDGHEDLGKLA